MSPESLITVDCVVSVKDSNSKAIHNKQFRMDVAGSEFFCYRGVRLDLRRKPVPAEGRDARSQPGMTSGGAGSRNRVKSPVCKNARTV